MALLWYKAIDVHQYINSMLDALKPAVAHPCCHTQVKLIGNLKQWDPTPVSN